MSEKMYTDEELCWASQLAYCNVSQKDIIRYCEAHDGEYPTFQEIFNIYGYDIFFDQKIMNDENEGDMLVMELEAKEFIDSVKAGTICSGWRVIAVSDELNQEREGFYAVTIQTGDEDAIVAFRGSEKTDVNQFIEDWVVADFTMLEAGLTEQEVLASDYLYKTINSTDYDNFAVTGHSLGGNLAIVSTIRAKYTDNQGGADIASRIKQTVSFDGPGHPQEFINQYQTEIDQMADVMTHYQWSWVGAILTSLCEENLCNIWDVAGKYEERRNEQYKAAC